MVFDGPLMVVAALRSEIKELNQQLAAAHGEIHRLRGTGNTNSG